MKWFYNMKIRIKLITAFIIFALLTGAAGAIGMACIINAASKMTTGIVIAVFIILIIALAFLLGLFISYSISKPKIK